MLPVAGATSRIPFSTVHLGSPPRVDSHFERSLPSKRTTASDGGGARRLNVAPGVTSLGWGRSPSWTSHGVPGICGVLLYPRPSPSWAARGIAAPDASSSNESRNLDGGAMGESSDGGPWHSSFERRPRGSPGEIGLTGRGGARGVAPPWGPPRGARPPPRRGGPRAPASPCPSGTG